MAIINTIAIIIEMRADQLYDVDGGLFTLAGDMQVAG